MRMHQLMAEDLRRAHRWRLPDQRFVASGKDEAIEFTELDLPEIATAIREGAPGLRELVHDGRRIVVAFVRLDSLGWYYVVQVDATTLGAR